MKKRVYTVHTPTYLLIQHLPQALITNLNHRALQLAVHPHPMVSNFL